MRDTIDKLRLKLLDLTSRNPLISFKHASRTRRYVRVIDELPNQLFEQLGGESGMRFRSLGRESCEPDDEKTVMFRRALAAARLEEPEYLRKLDELGEDPGEKAVDRLEHELRGRLREQLGMPPRRANEGQSPRDVAQRLNLNPSFDLPVSQTSGVPETRHTDSIIQTLLFEDDMQATLARMRDLVRLSIDEAGVNPLFCVFGFLEWYEDTNSETPLHAPLLLRPLAIDRKLTRGHYQYAVQATGEETQANVAIAERLKRDFNLVLPPYEESDTPEDYFTKVQQVVQQQKGWKVRRWITVGLFSFARIAMYHDLAPEQWRPVGGLERHEGLNRLIGGGGGGGDHGGGSPFTSDDGEPAGDGELEIPLIADADSSQLAALRDVLAGRNLVIEGPPGTGKSQTITNIIAAALAAGKTVLFLAEKMAALNVVRDRLTEAGLHDFCLELHSTKAGRKETAAAMSRRLSRAARPRSIADMQAALARLKTLRDGLGRYVEALAQPAGKLGITAQELLWRCHTVRQQSKDLPSEIDEITLPAADELTEIDIGRIVGAVEQFERARSRVVDSYGSVVQHPWHGVARPDIDPIRAEDIVRRVRKLADAAGTAEQVLEQVASLTDVRLDGVAHLGHVASALLIDEPKPGISDELVAQMATPQTLAVMECFASDLRKCSSAVAAAAFAFETADRITTGTTSELIGISDRLIVAGFGGAAVADVPALREARQRRATAWQRLAGFVELVAARANVTPPTSAASERALAATVELAARADPEALAGRAAPVIAPGAAMTLRSGIDRATTLKGRRLELGKEFQLSAVSNSTALRDHARAVRAAPAIPWISRGWRRARRAFLEISKERRRRKRAEVAQAFEDVASFVDEASAFSADEALSKCMGPDFKGIDTDFSPRLRVAEWADRVRATLPAGDELNNHLRRLLFEGTPDEIESLASLAEDPQMAQLRTALGGDACRADTVRTQAIAATEASAQADQIGEAVHRLRLKADFKLADCRELSAHVTAVHELRESLDSGEAAKTALGAGFRGHATDPEPILACARHVRNVDSAGLPPGIRQWLLQGDAVNRLVGLRRLAEEANKSVLGVKEARAALAKVAEVDFRQWLGAPVPMEVRATDLRDHAGRCASDFEGFQILIDDVRAQREAADVGMKPLLELFETHRLPVKGVGRAARRIVCQSMSREVISRNPALAHFSGDRHETLRAEFRDLDHKLKRLERVLNFRDGGAV